MADDARTGGGGEAPDQSSRPKQSRLGTKRLSDETVEDAKKRIFFGDVGYKRPPKEHQFKRGQSGNPKGRPKARALPMGDRSANALALKQADRMIAIREGEDVTPISAIEAVFRAQYATASKGNAYAQKHIIERYGWADREQRRQIQTSIEFWEEYVAKAREIISEAECKAEPPPLLLPHPDDVVIDRDHGVSFVGPIDEEELNQLQETCRYRDVLIMQDALDRREAGESGDPLDAPGTAGLFAIVLNDSMPDRFKLSDTEFVVRMMRYEGISKRQLLKDVYRGWRSVGIHRPRGKLSPPLRVGKERLALLFEVVQRFRDGRLDVDSPPEELEAEIATIMSELE